MIDNMFYRLFKAEAEVERLKAELAKLRKVVGAARRVMDAVMAQPQDVKERNIALAWLDAELAELAEMDKQNG